jgi:isoquinoline 1-oxidoreductase beta subunit
MTKHFEKLALTRRGFVVGSGVSAIAVMFGARSGIGAAEAAVSQSIGTWVSIGDDGIVTIVSPASEMGQGTKTAIPLMLAEDLDADWSKVRVVQAGASNKLYGNPKFNNQQQTVGSYSVTGYYLTMRLAGAQARQVLLANAAEAWKVPLAELTTEPGMVVHAKSNRKIGYGDIAKTARVPDPLPQVTKADLKPAAQFRLIGKDMPRVDVPSKVNGTAEYGIDVQLPGMLYGAIRYPDVQHEKALTVDDSEALKVPGVVKVVTLPVGVGVIAKTVEAAMRAKEALKVTWSKTAPGQTYTQDRVLADYRTIAADWSKTGIDMVKKGDADEALKGAAKVLTAEYFAEHVSHVCMEPLNATAWIDGDKVQVWSGSQGPATMQILASIAAGTKPENVTVHTMLLGGGFGRRSDGDDVMHATWLAKAADGHPVKLIWNRSDDMMNDKFRPLTVQRLEIGLDAKGDIVGWRHRIVNETYLGRVLPPPVFKAIGMHDVVSGGGGEMSYAVANHRVEWVQAARGVDVGAWRGIAAGYTKFAIETLIDELAVNKTMDPLQYRLSLLKGDPRAQAVVEAVGAMSKWTEPRANGRALGLAYSDALESHTAAVVEVSVDDKTGAIKVHHVWAAVDAGVAVQPKNIEAQMRGAMTFGLGAALREQIHIENGVVQERNFDSYRVMRMSDVPEMTVKVISNANEPTGIGEAGVPVIAPAIANAVAKLTGKRLRHMPMTPERVKQALG